MRISQMGLVAAMVWSTTALADPAAPPHDLTLKIDSGQVRQINTKTQTLVCDVADGQMTYNIAGAQLFDATGTLVTLSAAKLAVGQAVQVEYRVQPDITLPDHGAHATALRMPLVATPKKP